MEIINSSTCSNSISTQKRYFSHTLCKMIELMNFIFVFYFIVSHVFWIFTRIEFYEESDKILQSQEKSIILHIFNYLFFICFVCVGFVSINFRSTILLMGYLITLAIANLYFLFKNYSIFSLSVLNNQSGIFILGFNIAFSIVSFLISVFLIIDFLNIIDYLNFNSDDLSLHEIIKETKFKIDLIKIRINSFLISFGIHKFLPYILFKKNDYYFMIETSNEFKKKKNLNKSTCEKIEENLINSKSTIDSETELLNR